VALAARVLRHRCHLTYHSAPPAGPLWGVRPRTAAAMGRAPRCACHLVARAGL